jgi:lipopolysaccharide/colanic/teichoic acid biosynthesis glycosyltransferase
MVRKPEGIASIMVAICAGLAILYGFIALADPTWLKLLLVCAITISGVLVRGQRRRARLRSLVEFVPTVQADLSPVHLGAKPSPIAGQRFGKDIPPYIARPPFEQRLDAELRADNWVVVRGVANSGKSHAIYEAIGRVLPRHHVIMPREPEGGSDPLTQLLSQDSPLHRWRRYVLVVNDFDTRLAAAGTVPIPRWLRAHKNARLIATVSSERWNDLVNVSPGSATARLLSDRPTVTLSPEFHDDALGEARRRYGLPRGKTRLGEFLAEAEITVSRFDAGAGENPAGRALALSAVNCARAGLARPIALSRLLEMSRKVSGDDGRSFDEDDWLGAVGFCVSRPTRTVDLLHVFEEAEDPTVAINPAALEHAERYSRASGEPTVLPDHIWQAVVTIVAEGPEDLLAIGAAASWRRRPDLAEHLLRGVSESGDPGPAPGSAAELLRDLERPAEDGPVEGMLRRVSIGPDPDRSRRRSRSPLGAGAAAAPFDATPAEPSRWRSLYAHRGARDAIRFAVLLVCDVAAVLVGIALAHALGSLTLSPSSGGRLTAAATGVAAALVFVFFLLFGLYRADRERARLGEIIKGVGLVAFSLGALALGEGYGLTNLPLAALAAVGAIGLAYLFRWIYDLLSRRAVLAAKLQSRALLVDPEQPAATARLLLRSSRRPMQIVGYLAPRSPGGDCLGETGEMETVARNHSIDRLIIADHSLGAEERRALIYRAHTLDLATELVPSPAELIQGATDSLDEMLVPLIEVRPLYLNYVDNLTKRFIDIVLTLLIGAIVALPLLVIVSILRLQSPEPVIERTQRPGLGALYFGMLRLRTTSAGAPSRFGRWLERWRVDELPQLWNVLAGTMSLVGPRPVDSATFAVLDQFERARYVVRPGITGLWQISGRLHSLEDMTNLDLSYCRKWTPLLDLTVLLRTVPAIFADPPESYSEG